MFWLVFSLSLFRAALFILPTFWVVKFIYPAGLFKQDKGSETKVGLSRGGAEISQLDSSHRLCFFRARCTLEIRAPFEKETWPSHQELTEQLLLAMDSLKTAVDSGREAGGEAS